MNLFKSKKDKNLKKGYGYDSFSSFLRYIREPYTGAWQQNRELKSEDILLQSTVYSCINIPSSDLAKLQPRIMRQHEAGHWKEEWNSKYTPLLKKPNHFQNYIQFKEMYFNSKLAYGNTYVLIERDMFGNERALYILDPKKVRPIVTPGGDIYYQLIVEDVDEINRMGEGHKFLEVDIDLPNFERSIIVPASEIIHDRWNCFRHPLIGQSPLQVAILSASHALRIQHHSNKFFENSAMMSGILTAPGHIEDDTAQRAKEYFEKEFTGKGAGKIAVLGDGLEYKTMTMTSADAQLLEQLKFTAEQICGIFHIPPHMVLGTAPNYRTISVAYQDYYQRCLQIHIESFEECFDNAFGLNEKNKNNLCVDLNIATLLRMDTKTRYDTHNIAIKGSFKTINEVRLEEGLEPVEGGDKIWMQQQNYTMTALIERDKHNPLASMTAPTTSQNLNNVDEDKQEEQNTEEDTENNEKMFIRFLESFNKNFDNLEIDDV